MKEPEWLERLEQLARLSILNQGNHDAVEKAVAWIGAAMEEVRYARNVTASKKHREDLDALLRGEVPE